MQYDIEDRSRVDEALLGGCLLQEEGGLLDLEAIALAEETRDPREVRADEPFDQDAFKFKMS